MHALSSFSVTGAAQVLCVSFEFVGSKAMSSLYVTILRYATLYFLLCLQINP